MLFVRERPCSDEQFDSGFVGSGSCGDPDHRSDEVDHGEGRQHTAAISTRVNDAFMHPLSLRSSTIGASERIAAAFIGTIGPPLWSRPSSVPWVERHGVGLRDPRIR